MSSSVSQSMNKQELLQDAKKALSELYGERLRGVVLYGSVARGDDNEDSDVDILVLLDRPFDYVRELSRILDALFPLALRCGHRISAKPTLQSDYEEAKFPLYRSARREGTLL